MGKLDLGVNIAMRISSETSYAQPEYWYWRAVLFRKRLQYNEALFSIHQALKGRAERDNMHDLAVREKDFILWLESNEVKAPVASSLANAYSYNLDYQMPVHVASDATEFYDVLSIDGGGVRGLIPTFILSEIERRAGVPLYRLFHLHVGTSTGSIVAAALSLPRKGGHEPLMAREVADIYVGTQVANIFQPTWNIYGLFGPKYTNGRIEVFKDYFGSDTRMSQSLNEFAAIAAEHMPVSTRRFSKRSDPSLQVSDALVASSAAPTYFSTHKIGAKEFVDGGLIANNPGIEGHYEAMECKEPSQKIRVWSFGTGNLMPDPSLANSNQGERKNQGLLYWAPAAFGMSFDAQSRAVEDYMKSHAPGAFKRFQVWLDRPYAMDDSSEETLRALIENSRQFIRDHSAEIDEMVALLLRNRGY
jgi:predicted acylesterase/phospholipase RssA